MGVPIKLVVISVLLFWVGCATNPENLIKVHNNTDQSILVSGLGCGGGNEQGVTLEIKSGGTGGVAVCAQSSTRISVVYMGISKSYTVDTDPYFPRDLYVQIRDFQ